ncbi:hypothetical protein S7711_11032 [Stachybotrys chartarum IBT 7711]|uniref:Uncharacterized protein n=1 Tax=Stachybotrys chartarum (strain CBS 109288 / IBT 7711) TaxID=1280523 RepID=A0A084AG78_STACB|nr:hypothetical protein S7711_11032 [Stachybotrys chartarum IBT 7711]KFA52948.1 hypothetical protein S40293_10444 [Stachybotrys chartarum IBT 40293]KFA75332.1 hypothetical protein S40288_10470 [Stachybotrys chartarum IBT 40288]
MRVLFLRGPRIFMDCALSLQFPGKLNFQGTMTWLKVAQAACPTLRHDGTVAAARNPRSSPLLSLPFDKDQRFTPECVGSGGQGSGPCASPAGVGIDSGFKRLRLKAIGSRGPFLTIAAADVDPAETLGPKHADSKADVWKQTTDLP